MIADSVFERLKRAVDQACTSTDFRIASDTAEAEHLHATDSSSNFALDLLKVLSKTGRPLWRR